MTSNLDSPPIFIIGALNRSGTNFLSDIVELDATYSAPREIGEDYFLVYSNLLTRYTNETLKHWGKKYREKDNETCLAVMNSFGDVLLDQAVSKITTKNLVLKTPRAKNLSNCFKLFPTAKVVLLIRDGRDTTESFSRSFKGYSFNQISTLWAEGVMEIIGFKKQHENSTFSKQVKLFNYEDILNNKNDALDEFIEYCNLNKADVNPNSVAKMPLKGSSTNRGNKNELHWEKIAKPNSFNPINRWSKWTFLKKIIFKIIAGKALILAGYEKNSFW